MSRDLKRMRVMYCTKMAEIMVVDMITQGRMKNKQFSVLHRRWVDATVWTGQMWRISRWKDVEIQGCKTRTFTWRYRDVFHFFFDSFYYSTWFPYL